MTDSKNESPDEEFTWEQVPDLMDELQRIARGMIQRNSDYSLATTSSLLQTAFRRQKRKGLRLSEVTWVNRRYFFGAMIGAMRQALTDRARQRGRRIRAVSMDDIQLHNLVSAADNSPEQIGALIEVLEEMEQTQPQWAELINYRFFVDLTFQETADFMEISERTARRMWKEDVKPVLYREILRCLNDEAN